MRGWGLLPSLPPSLFGENVKESSFLGGEIPRDSAAALSRDYFLLAAAAASEGSMSVSMSLTAAEE